MAALFEAEPSATYLGATPRWIEADADIGDVLREMQTHRIRRLPVIDGKRLVGMISEADLARHLDDTQLSRFVEGVFAKP